MYTSTYQSIKLQIVDMIDLSKDAIHVHIGLLVFVATIMLWSKGKISPLCIVPVLAIAFRMEFIDLYDDYNSVGYMRWTNSLHDIINTIIWPTLIILLVKLKSVRHNN